MELANAIHNRRAVRAYTPQPVPAEVLKKLIDDAIMAPSASHSQPWAFGILQGREKLQSLSTQAKDFALAHIQEYPKFQPYVGSLQNAQFNIFYDAPVLIVVFANSRAPSPQGDAALAAQNLMLSAFGTGLGSCWIGLSMPYLNSAEFKKNYNVPQEMLAMAPIIVGYPQAFPAKPERKPPVILFND